MKENSINIIFAVTKYYRSVYNKLSQEIEGSSTATLTSDSSNVVDLVKEEYNVSYLLKYRFVNKVIIYFGRKYLHPLK